MTYLVPCQTSLMDLFCKNNQSSQIFYKKAPLEIFDSNTLQIPLCIRDYLYSMYTKHVSPPDTHKYVCVSGGKNVSFLGSFAYILIPKLIQIWFFLNIIYILRSSSKNESETHLFSLRKKFPNTKFFLVCIFPYPDWIRNTEYLSVFSPNAGKYAPWKILYLDTFHAVSQLLTWCSKFFLKTIYPF